MLTEAFLIKYVTEKDNERTVSGLCANLLHDPALKMWLQGSFFIVKVKKPVGQVHCVFLDIYNIFSCVLKISYS